MGGRGAFIQGTFEFKSKETKRFKTDFVIQAGEEKIKVISKVAGGSFKTPTLSHSASAIYGALKPGNQAGQLTVYGKDHEKIYDIDFSHDHSGKGLAYHVQYYINGKRDKNYSDPTEYQKKLVDYFEEGIKVYFKRN